MMIKFYELNTRARYKPVIACSLKFKLALLMYLILLFSTQDTYQCTEMLYCYI